jgi:hypothetical protein
MRLIRVEVISDRLIWDRNPLAIGFKVNSPTGLTQ